MEKIFLSGILFFFVLLLSVGFHEFLREKIQKYLEKKEREKAEKKQKKQKGKMENLE